MPAPPEAQTVVEELVERFKLNPPTSERATRVEFIDPFFKALGWDVANTAGYSKQYKEVVHEDSVLVGTATKAPDYSFRIGGLRKFFVEAKKPSVSVKGDPHPAYQLRRYAWSAKLPLSILTDFEEFAVYDCTKRPKQSDKASRARIMYVEFTGYPEQFDEIYDIFAKDSILKGSFDRYTEKARGTAEVDKEFLKEIEAWRTKLARNIALRNKDLDIDQMNEAVQKVIDRIIFLRMAEDRGIESQGRLLALTNADNIYARFAKLCEQADEKYNSGLFDFKTDEWTLDLEIDDKVLKKIIKSIYYPASPYEFSVLPADILGNVYEQFLGKVIRLTPAHRAKVEEKPEVKKAGGVYYTPRYIVDYIVEHTVGELIDGKSPRRLKNFHVLDPACGSGSFLLGAYQRLLDHHLDWYTEHDPEKHKGKEVYRRKPNEWALTTAERKRILTHHIFGVDIDPQAVEVTKLSLLLKVLEGETADSLGRQMKLFRERALPNLSENIKCGNSLIGPDYFADRLGGTIDPDELRRVNPFDWEAEFPDILGSRVPEKRRGFDAVIGNPPYGADLEKEQEEHLRERYECCSRRCDSFALFMGKSHSLLCPDGLLGMIVQSGWVSAPAFAPLREFFAKAFSPVSFCTMPYDVFGAYVDTVIVIARQTDGADAMGVAEALPVDLVVFPPRYKITALEDFEVFKKTGDAAEWLRQGEGEFLVTLSAEEQEVISKIDAVGSTFGDVMDIQRGVTPFKTTAEPPPQNPARAFVGTVRRYRMPDVTVEFIRYDESLAEYKPAKYFRGPRLLLREMISRQFRLQAILVQEDFVTNKSMQSLLLTDNRYDIRYCLGLLNSKLLSWYFLAKQSVARRDDFPKIVLKQSRGLPFRSIDFGNSEERGAHDRLAGLVEHMLQLHRKAERTEDEQERKPLQKQIAATDRQIDELVYELYGLTEKEIQTVEAPEDA